MQSLQLTHAIGVRIGMMISVEWLGRTAAAIGNKRRAAVLLGAAQALREILGVQIPPSESGNHKRIVTGLREALGDPAWTTAWSEGQMLPLEEAVAFALEGS